MKRLYHKYPKKVTIFDDPILNALLARASVPETDGIQTGLLVEEIFRKMAGDFVAEQFPTTEAKFTTRMDAKLTTTVIDPTTEAICVNVIRAGDEPSLATYRYLGAIISHKSLHRDHVVMSRTTNDQHEVTGAHRSAFKPSGPVNDKILVITDPMGATGGSATDVITMYKQLGKPSKIVVVFMIVTPECIKKITEAHPDVLIYAGRLDRGLSDPDVLDEVPGTKWDRERGLNDKSYIVPGAGGVGETMNNSLE